MHLVVNASNTQPYIRNDHVELNTNDLISDPGLSKRISDYHPSEIDKIREAYLRKGLCQLYTHNFLQKKIGNALRGFNPSWSKIIVIVWNIV